MNNHHPETLFDDVREDTQSRRHALVIAGAARLRVDVYGATTDFPVDMRRMYGVLDLPTRSACADKRGPKYAHPSD